MKFYKRGEFKIMKLKRILTTSFMAAALTAGAAVSKDTDILQNKQIVQNTNITGDMYSAQNAFAAVYEKAKDSVVDIRTKKTIVVETYNPLEAFLFGLIFRLQQVLLL